MSFLEQALAARAKPEVSDDLLDDWCDDDDALLAVYLMHPDIRKTSTEQEARSVLERQGI